MRSSRCPLGRLLGRNWFKWYTYLLQRYFSVSAEEAAYFSQSASAQPFGWRGAYAIRALPDLCLGIVSGASRAP
jgi:hypothetical protein